MNKKRRVILTIGAVISGLGIIANEIKNKKKIARLENEIGQLILSHESLFMYQHDKNKKVQERLDDLVDEFASVYTHMEVLAENETDRR